MQTAADSTAVQVCDATEVSSEFLQPGSIDLTPNPFARIILFFDSARESPPSISKGEGKVLAPVQACS